MGKIRTLLSQSQLLCHFRRSKRSFYALVSIVLLCLLGYNSVAIFSTRVPISAKAPPENVAGKSRRFFSVTSSAKLSSSVLYSVKEENPSGKLKTHLATLRKNLNFAVSTNKTAVYQPKRKKAQKRGQEKRFEVRVAEFFDSGSSGSSCKFRFFMTWISSMESFGDRELFAINSLFKTHPSGCLIIASNSLDSTNGTYILKPFLEKGLKITAISPDFNYLLKYTPAEAWYNQLMQGNVNPGEVPLGQNLSNLLRLGLLYRFGGIYLDTDIITLKSFNGLRNVIGAQTIDLETRKWSRLNNAVMIFDQSHPLLFKFIQEFALTFDGNKWGHNGPYLVSRVVSRVSGRAGYNFTILPPAAFYPVDWSRIGSLFEGPKNLNHSKWLFAKLKQIRSQSFAVHLWNKQSRGFEVQKGSIIQHILFSSGAAVS